MGDCISSAFFQDAIHRSVTAAVAAHMHSRKGRSASYFLYRCWREGGTTSTLIVTIKKFCSSSIRISNRTGKCSVLSHKKA